MRLLRTYHVQRARKQHDHCERCGRPIYPGEEYKGDVWVSGNYLYVNKEHYDCDWFNPDDDDMFATHRFDMPAAA